MELVYLYEGDYFSFLNLLFELLKCHIKPANIKSRGYTPSLFENVVSLDVASDEKIIQKMKKCFGKDVVHRVYYVFLSEEENKELILYYFLLNALKYRQNIIYRRDLKCVNETLRISQYVSHESHKMKGFLRFRELENGILYAEMEPTNNIISIVSNHFKSRMANEYWIIRDVRRGLLSIYDKKRIILVEEEHFTLDTTEFSEEEKDIERLWKVFYKTIGIEARKNERCRLNFMPKKYWKYIIEMEDE